MLHLTIRLDPDAGGGHFGMTERKPAQTHSLPRCLRIRGVPHQSIPKSSPQKRREAERQKTHRPGHILRCGARLCSVLPETGEDRGPRDPTGTGRARLSAPHRGSDQGFHPSARPGPRFLESPDANGRTLSAPVQRAPRSPITRRTGRCPDRRLCSVWLHSRTAPAPPQGVPSRKASFASGTLGI